MERFMRIMLVITMLCTAALLMIGVIAAGLPCCGGWEVSYEADL